MNIRIKAFLQVVGVAAAGVGSMFVLNWITPKYATLIFALTGLVYLMWCMYNIRLLSLKRGQDEIVDILKK